MTRVLTLRVELGTPQMKDGYDAYQAIAESGIPHNRDPHESNNTITDRRGNVVGSWRVGEEPAPEDIAQRVLDLHAIQPQFMRSGKQIAALIADAVRLDREGGNQ